MGPFFRGFWQLEALLLLCQLFSIIIVDRVRACFLLRSGAALGAGATLEESFGFVGPALLSLGRLDEHVEVVLAVYHRVTIKL